MKGIAKVPVVMQMEALECGAASLSMILAYYGKFVPLEKLREDCNVSRDGASALNIVKAARVHGLVASGVKVEPDDLIHEGKFPCIIHWNFNHFVVLKGFKRGRACINDPGEGDVSIPLEKFDKSFTGICLNFCPSETFEPGGKSPSVFAFLWDSVRGSKSVLLFVAILSVVISLLGIINPAFTRVFADRLLPGTNPDWLLPFVYLFASVIAIRIVALVIRDIYLRRILGKIAVVGSASFMWKLLRLPMNFFSQRLAGDLLLRQESYAKISNSLVNVFAPLVMDLAMLVFYVVAMLRYSVLLTFVGVSAVVVNILVYRYISHRRLNLERVDMRDQGMMNAAALNAIDMIETVKSCGAENGTFRNWASLHSSYSAQNVRLRRLEIYGGIIPPMVTFIADALVLGIGTYFVMQGEFSVGMIMAFQALLLAFNTPVDKLLGAGRTFVEMRSDMERVSDVMKYPTDKSLDVDENMISTQKLSGAIEIRNLTFGYSKLGEPLIKDFSLSINPGEKVAIVGMSGSGKSTLSKLISGLYKPWSGEILFDGKSIEQVGRSVFASSLAVVDQDIVLFEDTVAENIRMWDKSIEDFEVILAARDAQIHDLIMSREGGYSYRLLENGKDFSGGERQRIEIARVLAQDPRIVILDEATSALDAKTENEVVKAITNRGVTCIVIAHRLSTIRDCNKILVLDHGLVVESGTHDELMKNDGLYAKMIVCD